MMGEFFLINGNAMTTPRIGEAFTLTISTISIFKRLPAGEPSFVAKDTEEGRSKQCQILGIKNPPRFESPTLTFSRVMEIYDTKLSIEIRGITCCTTINDDRLIARIDYPKGYRPPDPVK